MSKNGKFVMTGFVALGIWGMSLGNGSGANPDLVVNSVAITNTAARGATIAVSDVTSNTSTLVQAGASTTYLYLNTNLNITGITEVSTHSVNSIGPRGKFSWNGNITIPTSQPTGTNYYIVVCDKLGAVTESNENNNTNTPPRVIVITP